MLRPRGEERLTVAKYKWVRDNAPKIFNKVNIYVCTNCSLDFSSTADADQREAHKQLTRHRPVRHEHTAASGGYKRKLCVWAVFGMPHESQPSPDPTV